jgi:hypothetical protein
VVTVSVCDPPVVPLAGREHPTPAGEPTTVHDRVKLPENPFTACSAIESVTLDPALVDIAVLVGCRLKSFTESVTFVDRVRLFSAALLPVMATVAFAAGVVTPMLVASVTTD